VVEVDGRRVRLLNVRVKVEVVDGGVVMDFEVESIDDGCVTRLVMVKALLLGTWCIFIREGMVSKMHLTTRPQSRHMVADI